MTNIPSLHRGEEGCKNPGRRRWKHSAVHAIGLLSLVYAKRVLGCVSGRPRQNAGHFSSFFARKLCPVRRHPNYQKNKPNFENKNCHNFQTKTRITQHKISKGTFRSHSAGLLCSVLFCRQVCQKSLTGLLHERNHRPGTLGVHALQVVALIRDDNLKLTGARCRTWASRDGGERREEARREPDTILTTSTTSFSAFLGRVPYKDTKIAFVSFTVGRLHSWFTLVRSTRERDG